MSRFIKPPLPSAILRSLSELFALEPPLARPPSRPIVYTAHFNLREPPFSIAPDPAFLYMSSHHQEALGHLLYGTGQYGGFVQLTGEVGTGKTTIVRTLLTQKLDNVDVAMVHNPRQNELEFVASICDELGVSYAKPPGSIKVLVDALNEHLLKAHAAGRRTVLIIDEAQNLDTGVLEQVRLLTNLETDKEKLLRIMLIGQPELIELLGRPELRQLASRITARYHLTPLTAVETMQYIIHRLQVAGGASDLFSDTGMKRVHHFAAGIPRQINIICDRALLGAYAKGVRTVTPEIVDHAAAEALGTGIAAQRPRHWLEVLRQRLPGALPLRWVEGALAVAALIVTGVLLSQMLGQHHKTTPPAVAAAAQAAETPATPAPATPPAATPATPAATPAPAAPPAAATPAPAAPVDADLGALRATAQPLPAVMAQLIGLWNPKITIPRGENVCRSLSRQGLECYRSDGQWADLAQLNRPAILSLNIAEGKTQYVLLRALSGDAAVFDSAAGPLRLPLSQLEGLWSGEFLLLWQRQTDSTSIGPGMRGNSVVWLRERLAQAQGRNLAPPVPVQYGPELRAQLMDFQNAHGLDADGVAGIRTLILLSEIGRPASTPVLSENGG
jgi:general secretion pathway protein A